MITTFKAVLNLPGSVGVRW